VDRLGTVNELHEELQAAPLRFGVRAAHELHSVDVQRRSQEGHCAQVRPDLPDQIDALAGKVRAEHGPARDVTARPRQAVSEARRDRVGDHRRHDRQRPGLLLRDADGRRCLDNQDIDLVPDAFANDLARALPVAASSSRNSLRSGLSCSRQPCLI